jgi:hypothetical protein
MKMYNLWGKAYQSMTRHNALAQHDNNPYNELSAEIPLTSLGLFLKYACISHDITNQMAMKIMLPIQNGLSKQMQHKK